MTHHPSPPRLAVLGVVLVLIGCSLFFFRGVLDSSDEQLMVFTSAAIWERGGLTFEQEVYGQRFTGYGIGMPVAGLPTYLLEKSLRLSGWIESPALSLAPLTGSVLFALIGAFVMLMAGARTGGHAVALAASPLLPASLTFYSELLAAAGMLGCAAVLLRGRGGGAMALCALLAAASVLARVGQAPFLLIVLAWGWAIGARRGVVVGGACGVAVGVFAALAQNWALRGSPFTSGYVGQDFTTPLTTGLFGLLISPERGLLLFWPACLLPALCWRHLDATARQTAALGGAVLLFSVLFFAGFWTWHGGWTAGPRFMLPAIALMAPAVAVSLASWAALSATRRWAVAVLLGWSAVMALIYSQWHAVEWWRQTWGLHQRENQWLFLPQHSLWQAALSGLPVPTHREHLSAGLLWAFRAVGAALAIGGVIALGVAPFRRGVAQLMDALRRPTGLAILLAVAALCIIAALRGPRGFQMEDGGVVSHLHRVGPGVYEGVFEALLDSPVEFSVRASAPYSLSFNGGAVLAEAQTLPSHWKQARVDSGMGRHVLRLAVEPRADGEPALLSVFCSWGGEGRWLEPVGGEYVTPRGLNAAQRGLTAVWRKKALLFGFGVALLIVWTGAGAGRRRDDADDSPR